MKRSAMTSSKIRQQFLDFFAEKGHVIVESSLVVPLDDPTLLFTNAGMNQFKDVFLGTGSRNFKRAADTQKCIRAGGKHNDLDDVGQDTYHHTFFEMLGNWSFGDYFKEEAIRWAWELMTRVWGIPKDRLHATYFQGDEREGLAADAEALDLWQSVTDIHPDHIHPGNKKDNFWEMGDTGPCGPCSEIHIDLTPDKSGASLVNAGDARVIELWNLVFIQFNRSAGGELTSLPAKHIDTGLGFERLCAVLQGMEANKLGQISNYDTDVFAPIFDAIQKRTNAPKYTATLPGEEYVGSAVPNPEPRASARAVPPTPETLHEQIMVDVSYRVIADHLRCLTFAITDGAMPSNEGRGYVLRSILRRAFFHGRQYMDMHEPFLCDLVKPFVDHMVEAFPELRSAHGGKNVEHVTEIIRDEELSFLKTLDRGIKLFNQAAITGRRQNRGRISGEDAFKLHDTYGFPIGLTKLMAQQQGLSVDKDDFERLMEEARELARSNRQAVKDRLKDEVRGIVKELSSTDETVVILIARNDERVDQLRENEKGILILNNTPFYAEQGGQVGDSGIISGKDPDWKFQVDRTTKLHDVYLHHGCCVFGTVAVRPPQPLGWKSNNSPLVYPDDFESLKKIPQATPEIDVPRRLLTTKNHTFTHLLNWALREVLCAPEERINPHVQQKGSLVDPEKTRFDFSHNNPLTDEQLDRIETLVNKQIEAKRRVYTQEVDQKDAQRINTLRAVFEETYPDKVRVVSIGADIGQMLADPENDEWMKFSVEFCGGTHLANSWDADRFVITLEEGVAKGVRRVVGVSGKVARVAIENGSALLQEAHALAGSEDGPHSGPYKETTHDDSAVQAHGLHSGPYNKAADDDPANAARGDLGADVAALQQKLNEVVIPIRLRHELISVLAGLQKKVRGQQKKAASASQGAVLESVSALFESAQTIGGVTVVAGEVPSAGADALRSAVDWIRNKTESSAVFLATSGAGKVTLIAGMSKSVVKKGVKAGDLIQEVAPIVGGRGGGRPDMAQGGGSEPSAIPDAILRATEWMKQQLS